MSEEASNTATTQTQAAETTPVLEAQPVAPTQPTPEQISELETKAAKATENWERLVRVTADFDNYKKRAAREREEAIRYANESLIERLIPILDNFDMALLAALSSQTTGNDSLKTGVSMIATQLRGTLTECGLEEVDAAGKAFDPNLHEAVSQQETAEIEEGMVVQQLRKGYKLKQRLLRPATVIIAKKPVA